MACNRLSESPVELSWHITEALAGAEKYAASLPLLINTPANIGADRGAFMAAEDEFRGARAALVPCFEARRAAVSAAYDFCLTARDVIQYFLGRQWSGAWLAAGWENSLAIPQGIAELLLLTRQIESYFTAHADQQVPVMQVTAARAAEVHAALVATNTAVLDAEVVLGFKRDARATALRAVRRRLCALVKELSIRLEPLDPRWLCFGFNLPGAPEVPPVPEEVIAVPATESRVQISCAPSTGATRYRFFVQRVEIDPEPVAVGRSTEPLFITEPLVAGAEYLIYVSAANEAAESVLSAPVPVQPGAARAA